MWVSCLSGMCEVTMICRYHVCQGRSVGVSVKAGHVLLVTAHIAVIHAREAAVMWARQRNVH